jgi:hypothetical protein
VLHPTAKDESQINLMDEIRLTSELTWGLLPCLQLVNIRYKIAHVIRAILWYLFLPWKVHHELLVWELKLHIPLFSIDHSTCSPQKKSAKNYRT